MTTNIVPVVGLPADPPETDRTSHPATWDDAISYLGTELPEHVHSPEAAVPTAPSVDFDAAGQPHVTVPLTKNTKAVVTAVGSTITTLATAALAYLQPDTTEAHIVTGVAAVVGILATTFGTHQVVNLPNQRKAGKHAG